MHLLRSALFLLPLALSVFSCTARVEKAKQPAAVGESVSLPKVENQPTSQTVEKAKPAAVRLENKTQTLPKEGKTSISKPRRNGKPPAAVLKNQTPTPPKGKEKATPKIVSNNEIPRRELVEISKLAAAKKNPVVRKVENFLIEAIPKKGTGNCNKVLVKVKLEKSKTERDYSVILCGESVEVKPR